MVLKLSNDNRFDLRQHSSTENSDFLSKKVKTTQAQLQSVFNIVVKFCKNTPKGLQIVLRTKFFEHTDRHTHGKMETVPDGRSIKAFPACLPPTLKWEE